MTREQAERLTLLQADVIFAMRTGSPTKVRAATAAFDDYVDALTL